MLNLEICLLMRQTSITNDIIDQKKIAIKGGESIHPGFKGSGDVVCVSWQKVIIAHQLKSIGCNSISNRNLNGNF